MAAITFSLHYQDVQKCFYLCNCGDINQCQAMTTWFAKNGRVTLKMATGSAKTITALAITWEFYHQIGLQVLLVVCPYRHLVSQ